MGPILFMIAFRVFLLIYTNTKVEMDYTFLSI